MRKAEWNRTVDVALVEGVPEEDILKIKQEKITDKTLQSIRAYGWLPDMFRQIIRGAKDFFTGGDFQILSCRQELCQRLTCRNGMICGF